MNNIFTRFALRSLVRNRTRTVVTIAGIILSSALLTAVMTSVVSMQAMLKTRTIESQGAWQVEALSVTPKQLDYVKSNDDIDALGIIGEMGAVQMDEKHADAFGGVFFVKTWPDLGSIQTDEGSFPLVCLPQITDGRAPAAQNEIVLPDLFRNEIPQNSGIDAEGPLELGSRVTLHQGTRIIKDNETGEAIPATSNVSAFIDRKTQSQTVDESIGAHTYTVVGFCNSTTFGSSRALTGVYAYVYPEPSLIDQALTDQVAGTSIDLLMTLHDPENAYSVVDGVLAADTAADAGGVSTHDDLLRWDGVLASDSSIFDTLAGIAIVLSLVIVLASVSLIYNAFAISVSERTRQFGLLASLGASRRQLRRCVLTEALCLGAVGIPLGVVLGLAGCQLVFSLTGDGLAALFYSDIAKTVDVSIKPLPLIAASALSLITLVISAWIPSRRAARVSATDAIRQTQDVRISPRERRRIERGSKRFFSKSTPILIARRNLTRSSSKSRVTVAALAISVALLLITGSVVNTSNDLSQSNLENMDGRDVDAFLNYAKDSQAGEEPRNSVVADADKTARIDDRVAQLPDVSSHGYLVSSYTDVFIPHDMLSDTSDFHSIFFSSPSGHDAASGANVFFLDQKSWECYLKDLGLERSDFCDTEHPRAILFNNYVAYTQDNRQARVCPFVKGGTLDTYTFSQNDLDANKMAYVDDDGTRIAVSYNEDGEQRHPLEGSYIDHNQIEVGALADKLPDVLGISSTEVTLLLPLSAAERFPSYVSSSSQIFVGTNGNAEAAERVADALQKIVRSEHTIADSTISNNASLQQQARLMQSAINTFIYSFSAITCLIAVCNVFNTVSNSFILRRKEFAVLKSIGMGASSFRKMIVYECSSYAVRGLLIGIALDVLANMGLSYAMSLTYVDYRVHIPLVHTAICLVATLAVIVASVLFALHKNKTSNVVETLRKEAI